MVSAIFWYSSDHTDVCSSVSDQFDVNSLFDNHSLNL